MRRFVGTRATIIADILDRQTSITAPHLEPALASASIHNAETRQPEEFIDIDEPDVDALLEHLIGQALDDLDDEPEVVVSELPRRRRRGDASG